MGETRVELDRAAHTRPSVARPRPLPSMPASLICAVVLIGALFALTGDIGLDLADEGFLWHGAQLTALGKVPLRDFQSYDPGRYYWGAAWSSVFGSGLMALRLSNAIFQALGLFCGLAVLRRVTPSIAVLALMGAVLTVWMFPRHKLFESSLALMAVLFAVRLLERPTARRHLVAGIFVGLAAFFGRNHGLYCTLGFAAVILFAHRDRPDGGLPAKATSWGAGVILGYGPMLLMLALVPGMWEAFVESLRLLGSRGTNVPRAIPWPWTLDYSMAFAGLAPNLVAGVGYVVMVVVYPVALVWALRRRVDGDHAARAVLIASVCIGLPYTHHSWVRASPSHLAQSIQPLLLAICAMAVLFGRKRPVLARTLTWGSLSISALLVAWGVHPELRTFGSLARRTLVEHEVAGDLLRIPESQARELEQLEAVVAKRVPVDESMFMAPFRVAYYPILGRVAPGWDLYMLWSASEEYQKSIVEMLEQGGVNWALIVDEFLLQRPDTAFTNSHRKVMRYFRRNFDPVLDPGLPDGHLLLRRRQAR
ncbi:MAG: hypothetical protein ACI8QZ_000245 [Chlamydiales bacterium]|jgi:hypothetical protein